MTQATMITYEIDADGVAIATFDQPGRSTNVLNAELVAQLSVIVGRLERDPDFRGLILTSAKPAWIVGADIDQFNAITTAEEAFNLCEGLKALLRRMEKCGKPVVAALNGTALGGGLEVALACHARFAIDAPQLQLGLPEVKLGLLPGGGATQRMPRMFGIQKSFELLTQGTALRVGEAKTLGLIDGLAADREQLLSKSREWCVANPHPLQPWDKKGFRIPGGDSKHPSIVQLLAIAPSIANSKSHRNYPAITHIMSCLFEGCLLDIDTALRVESRYFAACMMSQECRNMVGTLWQQLNSIKKGQSRPARVPSSKISTVGILGAGMMGAGIAYASAGAGIDVVLLDTSIENAQRGKAYSEGILDKAVSRGKSTPAKRDTLLARISTTTEYEDLRGCDLVIEAVFEDREIKAACTRKSESVIDSTAIYASNTSTLPITGLAKASSRPANFIGLHFFSPVDKMPLVEIIVSEQTSEETLARSFDYVMQIGKTPIVVNDSRGFYTSRVFAAYVMEGLALLGEGVHPRSIEVAGVQAGMPMPPLALQDEISLALSLHVADQTYKDLEAAGKAVSLHPGEPVLRNIGTAHGRLGKKAGRGFYDYTGKEKSLWPELTRLYVPAAVQPPQQELIDRLMYVQANEAARCFGEGVVRSVADANVGSIFGWGFAPFHGGALQFINATGLERFVARSRELAARLGERFQPADIIVQLAKRGAIFEDAA
jgi:3-hydroxyacyl-CoA dehydrogenase / enoyl-CoA hydratase / 3-hydroxybutyryl-CoA epimerase